MNLISEIDKIWTEKPDTKKLKKFGLLIGGLIIFLGAITALEIIVFIGFTVLILGIIKPEYLEGLYRVWMSLSVAMGYINSRLALLILFIFVIIPVGLFRNLLDNQTISKGFNKKKKSYWKKYTGTNDV